MGGVGVGVKAAVEFLFSNAGQVSTFPMLSLSLFLYVCLRASAADGANICLQVNAELQIPPSKVLQFELNEGYQ